MEKLSPDAEQRNYAKEPLKRREIEAIVAAAGSVAAVLNTRHKTAKERGWREKAPSKTAFVKAALQEPNLLRRPIVIKGRKAVVGKDLDAIRKLLG